jgi:hypothetical protein
VAKPLKTTMMIAAAPVISRAVEATPVDDRAGRVPGRRPGLVDAAEQEHLVVHREAEQDREQKDRHPRLDRVDLLEAEQAGGDGRLEDEHHDPVRRAD